MASFDEDLIRALQIDGRAQLSSLARQVGAHRSIVAQRVRELLGSGEVRVLAAVHPSVLGFPVQAHLMLHITGPSTPVFERIIALRSAVYISEVTGPAQGIVELWISSRQDLARAVAEIRAIEGVIEMQITLYDRVIRTMLLGEEPDVGDLRFDEFDIALMAELQRDGRLTFGELARRTGRSASACRARVLRLLDSRVMQIGAVRTRQSSTGSVRFGIGVVLRGGRDDWSVVEEAMLGIPGLEFLARTVGRHSLVATVAARSLAEYTEITRGLRALPGAHLVETWIHAAVWLERYEWNLEVLRSR